MLWWREIKQSRVLLIAIGFATAVTVLALFLLLNIGPAWRLAPYLVPQATIVDAELKSGALLRMGFRVIRRRICKVDLDRFMVRADTDEVVYRVRVPGGAGPIGDSWIAIEITVPDLEPGKYVYRTTIINSCEEAVYATTTPDVRFTVVP